MLKIEYRAICTCFASALALTLYAWLPLITSVRHLVGGVIKLLYDNKISKGCCLFCSVIEDN